jgi:hypothetical protein
MFIPFNETTIYYSSKHIDRADSTGTTARYTDTMQSCGTVLLHSEFRSADVPNFSLPDLLAVIATVDPERFRMLDVIAFQHRAHGRLCFAFGEMAHLSSTPANF